MKDLQTPTTGIRLMFMTSDNKIITLNVTKVNILFYSQGEGDKNLGGYLGWKIWLLKNQ